jgi:hypothetical protein
VKSYSDTISRLKHSRITSTQVCSYQIPRHSCRRDMPVSQYTVDNLLRGSHVPPHSSIFSDSTPTSGGTVVVTGTNFGTATTTPVRHTDKTERFCQPVCGVCCSTCPRRYLYRFGFTVLYTSQVVTIGGINCPLVGTHTHESLTCTVGAGQGFFQMVCTPHPLNMPLLPATIRLIYYVLFICWL